MLVCNVSLRMPRTIAVSIGELAAAIDTLNGFVGDLFVGETATAADTVNAAAAYAVAVSEAAAATDLSSVGGPVAAAMAESAAAADTQDATVTSGLVARSAMLPDVFVNSDGTSRAANAHGVMVNL